MIVLYEVLLSYLSFEISVTTFTNVTLMHDATLTRKMGSSSVLAPLCIQSFNIVC